MPDLQTATKLAKAQDPLVTQIATTLGETEHVPLMHIRRIVQTLGSDRTLQLLAQAQAVEAQGGLMVLDGSRRQPKAASNDGDTGR